MGLVGVVFIVAVVVVVVSASGYRFNLQTFKFSHTGLIAVNYTPQDAKVTLNGQPVTSSSGATTIDYLLPGRYTVDISKPGYNNWEETFFVEAEKAYINTSIILYRTDAPIAATADQVTTFSALGANNSDSIDIRGNEIWVKPAIRTSPILVTQSNLALIARYSQPAVSPFWTDDKMHIVFQLGNSIHVIDRDGSNDVTLATLDSADPVKMAIINNSQTLIYQVGETYFQRAL